MANVNRLYSELRGHRQMTNLEVHRSIKAVFLDQKIAKIQVDFF